MPNYIEHITTQLAEHLDGCPVELLRGYAVLTLVKGVETTDEDVHTTWSAWQTATDPGHRSILPFPELTAEVQAMDTRYAEAIRAVAAGLG